MNCIFTLASMIIHMKNSINKKLPGKKQTYALQNRFGFKVAYHFYLKMRGLIKLLHLQPGKNYTMCGKWIVVTVSLDLLCQYFRADISFPKLNRNLGNSASSLSTAFSRLPRKPVTAQVLRIWWKGGRAARRLR